MLTREEILGAIGRAWCAKPNTGKPVDIELGNAIADQILALRGMGGEAVATVKVYSNGNVGMSANPAQLEKLRGMDNAELYTAPAAPANEEIVGWMSKGGATIDAKSKAQIIADGRHGGEFEVAAKSALSYNIPLIVKPGVTKDLLEIGKVLFGAIAEGNARKITAPANEALADRLREYELMLWRAALDEDYEAQDCLDLLKKHGAAEPDAALGGGE